jgi:hypothetical protein
MRSPLCTANMRDLEYRQRVVVVGRPPGAQCGARGRVNHLMLLGWLQHFDASNRRVGVADNGAWRVAVRVKFVASRVF